MVTKLSPSTIFYLEYSGSLGRSTIELTVSDNMRTAGRNFSCASSSASFVHLTTLRCLMLWNQRSIVRLESRHSRIYKVCDRSRAMKKHALWFSSCQSLHTICTVDQERLTCLALGSPAFRAASLPWVFMNNYCYHKTIEEGILRQFLRCYSFIYSPYFL